MPDGWSQLRVGHHGWCRLFWHVRRMSKILCTVADAFETDIVSEHDAQFWGFDREEEWERWQKEHAGKTD